MLLFSLLLLILLYIFSIHDHVDPTSTLHQLHIDPTSTLHRPLIRYDRALGKKKKQTNKNKQKQTNQRN